MYTQDEIVKFTTRHKYFVKLQGTAGKVDFEYHVTRDGLIDRVIHLKRDSPESLLDFGNVFDHGCALKEKRR